MIESIQPSRVSAVKVGIVIIPALLIVSICIALYLGATEKQEPSKPVEGEVTVSELSDYLKKLNRVIGERGVLTESGRQGLRQTTSMIQGTLGPENLGYEIFVSQTDALQGYLWQTIWIQAGEEAVSPPCVVAFPYGENGTPIAFALGFAEYLTSHPAKSAVQLVFYPPISGDGELREWIQARSGNGAAIDRFVVVKGGGSEGSWASAMSPLQDRDILNTILGKKGWDGKVHLEDEASPEITFRLSESGLGSTEAQSERLIRAMPLLKALIDELMD